MKLAIIKTGGKQYKVQEGKKIKIEKINGEVGSVVDFNDVLLVADDNNIEIGQPVVSQKIKAKILNQGKGDKIRVLKYKAKIRYKKVYGHRQPFTEVQIEKIA